MMAAKMKLQNFASRVTGMKQSWRRPASRFILPSFKLCFSAVCALLAVYFLLPSVLHAQGCAMCYTSASAAQSAAKQALANGTLILLVPPLVFFALITVVLYKYRNKYRDEFLVGNSESAIVQNSEFEIRNPPAGTSQEESRIAADLRYLEDDHALLATGKPNQRS